MLHTSILIWSDYAFMLFRSLTSFLNKINNKLSKVLFYAETLKCVSKQSIGLQIIAIFFVPLSEEGEKERDNNSGWHL
jgi:hypothetical protein